MSKNSNSTTFERFPNFSFTPEQLATIHCSRRQLGRQDDIANSVLVMASALSKANTTNDMARANSMGDRLVKFLNNNATSRLFVDENQAVYTFGFGNGASGVVHDFVTGRFRRHW